MGSGMAVSGSLRPCLVSAGKSEREGECGMLLEILAHRLLLLLPCQRSEKAKNTSFFALRVSPKCAESRSAGDKAVT